MWQYLVAAARPSNVLGLPYPTAGDGVRSAVLLASAAAALLLAFAFAFAAWAGVLAFEAQLASAELPASAVA
jgi:hypothetical protein